MLARNLPRGRRARIAVAAAVVLAGALGLTAGMVSARPARVFGVDGPSLAYSVARNTGGISVIGDDTCREHRRHWTCAVSSDGSSGLSYRVRSDSRGCWTARHIEQAPAEAPRRASGCIGILDYVRFVKRAAG